MRDSQKVTCDVSKYVAEPTVFSYPLLRLPILTICFALFSVSEGLACSWDLNGVGYPPECGYRGRGGGGGAPQQAPQQTQEQFARPWALSANNQGIAAKNAGNWDRAVVLFQTAADWAPNDPVIIGNLRMALAHVANDKGIKAANAGNWVLALSLYERALINSPNDPVIADNFRKARAAVATKAGKPKTANNSDAPAKPKSRYMAREAEIAEQQWKAAQQQREAVARQQDKNAADNMQQEIKNLAHSLNTGPPSSGPIANVGEGAKAKAPLDFMGSNTVPSVTDTTAASQDANTKTGLLGGRESNPDKFGEASNKTVSVATAADQASSIKESSEHAVTAKTIEEIKAESNCGFDKELCVDPVIAISKPSAQSAKVNAFAYRIANDPRLKDDPIQTTLKYYLLLDTQVLEKQAQLATIQKEIDGGKGDPKILNAQKGTLENDVRRFKADQATAKMTIKDQVKKLNLADDFPDEAPPSSAAAAKTDENGSSAGAKQ